MERRKQISKGSWIWRNDTVMISLDFSFCLTYSIVHEILQARILEWVAIPFSRGSSWPRDWTQVSCIAGKVFTIWATRKALYIPHLVLQKPATCQHEITDKKQTKNNKKTCFLYLVFQLLNHVTLCNPMDCSTPGFPILHQYIEFAQIHVHRVSDAIWPSHPLSSSSPPAFNLYHQQGLF